MNPTWITAALAVGGILVQAGFAVAALQFMGKRLDQHDARLDENDETLGVHDRLIGEHWVKIERNEEDIEKVRVKVFNGGGR